MGMQDYIHIQAQPQRKAPFTRYNLLSNRLSSRFDNRVALNVCIHNTTGCIMYTNIQPVVKPV